MVSNKYKSRKDGKDKINRRNTGNKNAVDLIKGDDSYIYREAASKLLKNSVLSIPIIMTASIIIMQISALVIISLLYVYNPVFISNIYGIMIDYDINLAFLLSHYYIFFTLIIVFFIFMEQILPLIGLFIQMSAAKSAKNENSLTMKTTGFNLIKFSVYFNFLSRFLLFIVLISVSIYYFAYLCYTAPNINSELANIGIITNMNLENIFYMIILTVIAVLIISLILHIIYSIKMLSTIDALIYAAETGFTDAGISVFVIVMSFVYCIVNGIVLPAALLYGIPAFALLRYRNKIKKLKAAANA